MTGDLDLNMKREQQRNLLCCSGFGPALVARLQVPVQRLVIGDKIRCYHVPLFVGVSTTTTRALGSTMFI